MLNPEEFRRVAIRCRKAAEEAVDAAAANELGFLAEGNFLAELNRAPPRRSAQPNTARR
jgi:hypothetical protein